MNPKDPTSKISEWLDNQNPAKEQPHLSVVIPAFNEQWRLPPTLLDIVDYLDQVQYSYEIIVVDDGSRDETSEIVRKFEKVRPQVRLIRLPQNQGKGHAVRLGVLNATGERVIFVDADGATPFNEVKKLLKALDDGADVAIGSRALFSEDTQVKTRWYRKYLGRVFNLCVNVLILPGIADTQCGFKIFTRKAAQFLFSQQKTSGFSFDVEILYLAKRAGLKIREIPINWTNVPGSKVNLVLDASKMFWDVLRLPFWHRQI